MVFTVTRRGQVYWLMGGKNPLWNEDRSQRQHNSVGAQDHGQEGIKINSTFLWLINATLLEKKSCINIDGFLALFQR